MIVSGGWKYTFLDPRHSHRISCSLSLVFIPDTPESKDQPWVLNFDIGNLPLCLHEIGIPNLVEILIGVWIRDDANLVRDVKIIVHLVRSLETSRITLNVAEVTLLDYRWSPDARTGLNCTLVETDLSKPLCHEINSILILRLVTIRVGLERKASKTILLSGRPIVLSGYDLNRLSRVALDQTDPIHVLVESDRALRPADNLDGRGGSLVSLELQGEVVALLFGRLGAKLGISGDIMERACNLRVTDNDVRLKLVDGLPEDGCLTAFRRNGEAD